MESILIYEVTSLVAQTALFTYCAVYVWRVRRTSTRAAIPVFVFSGLGLLCLLSHQIMQLVNQMRSDAGPSDARELIEATGFLCMFFSVHLYHSRQLSIERIRSDAAGRLRAAVSPEEQP